jgi:hypothetical protein
MSTRNWSKLHGEDTDENTTEAAIRLAGQQEIKDIQWWTEDGQPRIWAIFEAERLVDQQNGESNA